MEDLNKLYKDLTHYDPHIRQNAVWGLGKYFQDNNTRKNLSPEEKTKIVNSLLTRLEPKEGSIEVKGRTVKIFSQIAKFLTEAEIVQIFSKIINYLINENSEGKDIYVTCIKTIFKEAPGSCCYMIGKVIVPVLITGISSSNKEIQDLCLNAFTDYINTFDYVLIKENESVITGKENIIKKVVSYIESDDLSLQTNAINFIGTFSLLLNKKQIQLALDSILHLFKKAKDNKDRIAYFNALNSIAKTSATKQLDYVKVIFPLISQYSKKSFLENDAGDYDEKNDLAESALNLLETYILKLNTSVSGDCKEIVVNNLELIEFDPNYSYEDQNMDEGGEAAYDDEYEDYEQVAVMEDSSWKVRRAAVNVLHSIIKSGITIEKEQKQLVISKLVQCLREHDENTKMDIISCLESYLSTLVFLEHTDNGNQLKRMSSMVIDFIPTITTELIERIIGDLKCNNTTMINKILQLLPVIALIGSNDIIGAFDSLKPSFDATCFSDNANTLIFFHFLSQLFQSNKVGDNYTLIYQDIVDYIEKGVSNEFYKISIEAINACYYLFPLLSQEMNENKKYIMKLYNILLPKFRLNDLDQELKMSLISTIGQMIISCGSLFDEKEINELFKIYLEKTPNENIRPHVFNWLIKIINENKGLHLSKAISQFKSKIFDLLQNSPLHVQFQILSLTETIYRKIPEALKGEEKNFVKKFFEMKHEDSLVPLIYNVLVAMLNVLDATLVNNVLVETAKKLQLISTSGSQLNSLFNFSKEACSKTKAADVKKIIAGYKKDIKSVNENVSKFIATLAAFAGEEKSFIDGCLSLLSSSKDIAELKNALTLIGDICMYSKNNYNDLIGKLEAMISNAKDEIKVTISVAIGKIGLSDPVSFISKTCSQKATKFTFVSLREFLSLLTETQANISDKELQSLFNWLYQKKNLDDKDINNLCGECLGLLAGYKQTFIADYIKGLNGDINMKIAFYYGLKFIFSKKAKLSPNDLGSLIVELIEGLKDTELKVKENAFNSLLNAAHNYKDAIKSKYDELMGIFEEAHKVNKKWIEEVDFGGGCKIKNDKGIGIRKAVFNTIKLFVDNFPTKINVPKTIEYCLDGLHDTEDIQLTVFSSLIKVAHLNPSAFISSVDTMCDKLKMIMDKIRSAEAKKEFIENTKKLFAELKEEHEVSDNPKYVNLSTEIAKV